MRIHFVEVIEPASVPETTVERDARGAEPTQPASALYPSLAATTDYCGRRHYVFDVALSRGKHRTVGARLPAIASVQSVIFVGKIESRASALLQKTRFFSGLQVV